MSNTEQKLKDADTAHDAKNIVQDTAHDVKNAIQDAAHDAKNKVQDAADDASSYIVTSILVAFVGAVILIGLLRLVSGRRRYSGHVHHDINSH